MATTTIIWVGAAAAVTWESSSESLSVTPSVRRRGSWRQHCVQTQVNGGSPRRYILLYYTIHICPKKIFYSHLSLLLPGKLMKLGVLCTYISINYIFCVPIFLKKMVAAFILYYISVGLTHCLMRLMRQLLNDIIFTNTFSNRDYYYRAAERLFW